ncbi:MAG: hypothetical protein HYY17_15820 [Planctomycetes bacterium]|nr:hypothetical protein [Planctomycetota bacterium]
MDSTKMDAYRALASQVARDEYRRMQQEETNRVTVGLTRTLLARSFSRLEAKVIEPMGLAPGVREALSPILKEYQRACEDLACPMFFEEDTEKVQAMKAKLDEATQQFLSKVRLFLDAEQLHLLRENVPPFRFSAGFPWTPTEKP